MILLICSAIAKAILCLLFVHFIVYFNDTTMIFIFFNYRFNSRNINPEFCSLYFLPSQGFYLNYFHNIYMNENWMNALFSFYMSKFLKISLETMYARVINVCQGYHCLSDLILDKHSHSSKSKILIKFSSLLMWIMSLKIFYLFFSPKLFLSIGIYLLANWFSKD